MKKILALILVMSFPAPGLAASGNIKLDAVDIDLGDKPSLQRGARLFVNYCLSCHSASYMRYNRMGQDLGIKEELVKENLLFAADKVGELMKAVMPPADAKLWFGTAPPDLSVTARSRGAAWIYTYMRSFYRDESASSGWNNLVFPHVAMPHVLYEWQGEQRAKYRTESEIVKTKQKDGTIGEKTVERQVFDGFELAKPGTKTKEEFDSDIRDLVNFMVYLAEPAKLVRYQLGVYVLIFLGFLFVAAYLLKKEYWKDIH